MQSIYAELTGGPSAFYIYICIVLDLAVGLTVCRASMLNWLGVHMPSIYIYMHCTRSSSGFNSMQGNYAELTGGSIYLLYICIVLISSSECSSIQGIYAQLIGCVHLPSIYMHCTISSSGCSGVERISAWLTGESIYLLYICIVLDLAVGVAVCKAFLLTWLGGPSNFYIYALY